ncbi:MAG TPA: LacI family transcriptional regulator [Bacteroidetes bacterium]|nr:LacI family transcriptional regulator [Bacteroidota bacterium]
MIPTLKDVAERAGVHPSTVSRVLQGKENLPISEKTRTSIFAIAKELNYQPNQLARAFRLKKTQTIGLIVPDISNPFFSGIARSIEICSRRKDYTVVLGNTDENQDREIRMINNLLSRGIDGLILAPVQDRSGHIKDLCNRNFPLVLIDRCFDELETNAVISDNEEAAFNAISYLAQAGHRRIGFISGRKNIYTIRKRFLGYQKGIKTFDLVDDSELVSDNGFTLESGYHSTRKILSLPKSPTALLISGNKITVGAMKAIFEKKLSIPDDISLIGFTDFIGSPYWVVPMTTITHPVKEMGEAAFNLLFNNMATKETVPHSKMMVATKLNIRGSVKNLALADFAANSFPQG